LISNIQSLILNRCPMKELHKTSFAAAVILLLAIFAGCKAVGPDYRPVEVAVPSGKLRYHIKRIER